MASQPPLPLPRERSGNAATLGVCLGNVLVGVALATEQRLLRGMVHTLPSGTLEVKFAQLVAVLGRYLAYGPRRVVLIGRDPAVQPLAARCHGWLTDRADAPQLEVCLHEAAAIRSAFVGGQGNACSNRRLGDMLAERFPELARPQALAADGQPLRRFGVPSSSERRWARLSLAVGAALLAHEPVRSS